MAEVTEQPQGQSATGDTSTQATETSQQKQPEQRHPSDSSTPAAPEAETSTENIRDPEAYAKSQVEKFQRLLEKKEAELQQIQTDSQTRITKLEERLKSMSEESQKQWESELSELKDNLNKAREEAATASLERLQVKVAVDTGLPLSFANRLKGATEDELKADAEALLKEMPKPTQQTGSPLGNRAGSSTPGVPAWRDNGQSGFGLPKDSPFTGG